MALTELGKEQVGRKPQLTEAEDTARKALDLLFRLSARTDDDLGTASGFSRQTFQNRRRGFARIRRGEDVQLAAAFDVDPACFSMTLDDLWQWLHTEERGRVLLTTSKQWITASADEPRSFALTA